MSLHTGFSACLSTQHTIHKHTQRHTPHHTETETEKEDTERERQRKRRRETRERKHERQDERHDEMKEKMKEKKTEIMMWTDAESKLAQEKAKLTKICQELIYRRMRES